MRKKIIMLFLSALLLTGLGKPAAAEEQTGSIRITMDMKNGEVTLYHAGTPTEGGYRLAESFGGGYIKEEDAHSPHLAQWLAESAEEGRTLLLDADGSADFSHLEEGLYLIKQSQAADANSIMMPFLVSLPYYGQWNIEANPKTGISAESPRTGQTPEPFIGVTGMVISGTALLQCIKKRRKQ